MNEFEKLLSELRADIEELEKTFIHRFIEERITKPDEIAEPDEYEHHVKAYCVLCHAAFEKYFEDLALKVMDRCFDERIRLKKYTDTLVTLVSYYEQKLVIDLNENADETRVFDHLRCIFDEVKRKFSVDVHNNHGISLKYLRRLLIPVAIDIKEDIRLKNSLHKLASERGEYAHNPKKSTLAPEDAKDCVQDCLELCEDIKERAKDKFT